MKKTLFSLLFVVTSLFSFSQSMNDLFQPSSVKFYWFGIDFSHVRLIGSFTQFAEAGATGPELIKTKYFDAWNGLFVSEADKYNAGSMLRKEGIIVDLNPLTVINKTTPLESLEADIEPNYSAADVQNFVKNYDFGVKEGIGVFLLAEALNKNFESGTYHIVFVNLATNDVLYSERMVGKAGGFGIRNYYAKSFYSVMEEIRDSNYKKWKKTFSAK